MTKTSLLLSKKLSEGGCKIKTNHYWDKDELWQIAEPGDDEELCPAYDLLWDICVKHAKEFFGDDSVCSNCGLKPKVEGWLLSNPVTCPKCRIGTAINYYEKIAREVLRLLQENKIQEAEDYIWEHCKFNKNNK